jgi:hypothetical protein
MAARAGRLRLLLCGAGVTAASKENDEMNRAMIASIIAAAAAGVASAQPVQWRVEDGGNGHWYEMHLGFGPCWERQRQSAAHFGGHLATITSPEEFEFVQRLLAGNEFIAVGGFQQPGSPEPAGGWSWVTGEPWGPGVRWATGQPENFQGTQDRLIMTSSGFHDGDDCPPRSAQGYVIEWSADCNGDGLVDKGQILAGELSDTNNNGIPEGPGIAVQPQDQSSADGGSVSFTVQVNTQAQCASPVTYRWQRRNPAIPDPTAPGAWFDLADDGTFANTDRPTMTIVRPGPALATGFRCKIRGGCGCEPAQGGFIYTDTVNFTIACPADFNADGGIDFGDVEAFFERWENGC